MLFRSATQQADAIILGLRLMSGVSIEEFRERFGVSPDEAYGAAIAKHERLGLLERVDGRLRLTDRGLLLSNEVFVDLLPEPGE